MEKILPQETKDPEKEPEGIGAATEPPAGQIKISKTEWSANELAFVLGLRKEFNEANGQVTYGVTGQNVLISLIGQMIQGHEQSKRERLGLRSIGGGINLPGNPFTQG